MTRRQPSAGDRKLAGQSLRILEQLAGDPDTSRLFAEHPELTRGDVQAALAYARDLLKRTIALDPARERRFRAMLAVARRNPDVDGDALLEELERDDAQRRVRPSA